MSPLLYFNSQISLVIFLEVWNLGCSTQWKHFVLCNFPLPVLEIPDNKSKTLIICFSFPQDHCSIILVAQWLKTAVSWILYGFLVYEVKKSVCFLWLHYDRSKNLNWVLNSVYTQCTCKKNSQIFILSVVWENFLCCVLYLGGIILVSLFLTILYIFSYFHEIL